MTCTLLASEQCDCSRPQRTGTFVFGREVCRLCEKFIRTQAKTKTPAGEGLGVITREIVSEVVVEALKAEPNLSQTDLRRRVDSVGPFPMGSWGFYRIVRSARESLGITVVGGRKPGVSAA